MSDVKNEIAELEDYITERKTLSDMADAAVRLYSNPDFKSLILNGFCLVEAARYAQESGDPMLTADQRADALNMAQASGHLKRFLSLTVVMGNTATRDIRQAEAALVEARSEA